MDTCIALRTMMTKDGVVYLQAGGGIVFDSDEGDELVHRWVHPPWHLRHALTLFPLCL